MRLFLYSNGQGEYEGFPSRKPGCGRDFWKIVDKNENTMGFHKVDTLNLPNRIIRNGWYRFYAYWKYQQMRGDS